MLARLYAQQIPADNEEAANSTAQKAFTDLASVLQALDVATKGAEFRKTFDETQSGVATYRDTYRRHPTSRRPSTTWSTSRWRPPASRSRPTTEAIKTSGMAEEKQEERDTLSTMASTSSLILYLSVWSVWCSARCWPG